MTDVFPKDQRPTLEEENVIGTFYDAEDDMLVYINRNYQEGDPLPVINAFPSKEDMIEMMATRSFYMAADLAKKFKAAFYALREACEGEDGKVDSAD